MIVLKLAARRERFMIQSADSVSLSVPVDTTKTHTTVLAINVEPVVSNVTENPPFAPVAYPLPIILSTTTLEIVTLRVRVAPTRWDSTVSLVIKQLLFVLPAASLPPIALHVPITGFFHNRDTEHAWSIVLSLELTLFLTLSIRSVWLPVPVTSFLGTSAAITTHAISVQIIPLNSYPILHVLSHVLIVTMPIIKAGFVPPATRAVSPASVGQHRVAFPVRPQLL